MSQFLCRKCNKGFDRLAAYEEHCEKEECDKEQKMTRDEALKIANMNSSGTGESLIKSLEALGLLKFENEKKGQRLFEINATNVHWDGSKLYPNDLTKFNDKYGVIRLEEWSEGLVLWVGGEIVWRSWGAPLGSAIKRHMLWYG